MIKITFFFNFLICFSSSSNIFNNFSSSQIYISDQNLSKLLNDFNFPYFDITITGSGLNFIINETLYINNNLTIIGGNLSNSIIFENFSQIQINGSSNLTIINFYFFINEANISVFIVNSYLNLFNCEIKQLFKFSRFFIQAEHLSTLIITNFTMDDLNNTFDQIFTLFYLSNMSFLKMENIHFQQNFLNNFIFLKTIETFIQIINLTFNSNEINNDKEICIFNINNNFEIIQSHFLNNFINSTLFCESNEAFASQFLISSCLFKNNQGISNPEINLIYIENGINFIKIDNIIVLNHVSQTPLIKLNNVNILLINSSDFIENLSYNLLFLTNINILTLEKTNFQRNNQFAAIIPPIGLLGPCLKVYNFFKILINICKLSNSFGNCEVPGFSFKNSILKNDIIQVYDSVFINNTFYSQYFVESYGCVFWFDSIQTVQMAELYFKENKVNLIIEAYGVHVYSILIQKAMFYY